MSSLRPRSVDLIFCDLPSGQTQASFDKQIDLDVFWRIAKRIRKKRAPVILMASSFKFAMQVVSSNPKEFRYDLIWRKGRATGFLNANKMPLRTHEFLLIFYASLPKYRPQMRDVGKPIHTARQGSHGSNYGKQFCRSETNAGSTIRHPVSVLDIPVIANNDPKKRHPQQKPDALLRWVIESFTDEGDLVVDPCAGSGSMYDVSVSSGRRFLGWDLLKW